MKSNTIIRPCYPEDVPALLKAADAEEHAVIAPTHVILRNGEFVGYSSIAAVPLVLPWLHKDKVTPLDTLKLISFAEGVLTAQGHNAYATAVPQNSPFMPAMQRLRFNHRWDNISFQFKHLWV